MTPEDRFINAVLERVPYGARRRHIEMDLRAHIAERVEAGQPVEEAIRQFGDPPELADRYLASIPLVAGSLGARAIAKIIDFGFIIVLAFVLILATTIIRSVTRSSAFLALPGEVLLIIACVLTFVFGIPAYFLFSEYNEGSTVGKQAMGLRVVTESGARISLGQSLVRQIPLFAQVYLIDILFTFFTDKQQRAFEMLSKTRVVKDQAATAERAAQQRAVA